MQSVTIPCNHSAQLYAAVERITSAVALVNCNTDHFLLTLTLLGVITAFSLRLRAGMHLQIQEVIFVICY